MPRSRSLIGIAAVVLAFAASALAATSGSQSYTMNVPSVLSVSGPGDVVIAHDHSDSNNSFGVQQYAVSGNQRLGATVTFATSQAFTHSTASSYKRNARLDLAIASSDLLALWLVTTASDQTDYRAATPDGTAQVAAASALSGNATFNLTVTFLTEDFSTIATGSYSTTVTATLTAN